MTSNDGVPACGLVCKRRESIRELLSIEVIVRAEKAGTKYPILRDQLGERLRDS